MSSIVSPTPAVSVNNEISMCQICCKTYNSTTRAPVVLSCGHSFCKECIKKGTVNKVCKCHECQSQCAIGINGPTVNVTLIRMLDSLNLLAADDTPITQIHVEVEDPEIVETRLVSSITGQLIECINQDGNKSNTVQFVLTLLGQVQITLYGYTRALYDRLVENEDNSDDGSDLDDNNGEYWNEQEVEFSIVDLSHQFGQLAEENYDVVQHPSSPVSD